ncbi:MAG: DNA repair protein RadA [Saprospiraceae bacterium]|nr:DNA repair protein RadA [Saprospiraceae bacterium]
MSKVRTSYVCSNCGTSYARWEGKCASCGTWNSLQEEVVIRNNEDMPLSRKAGRKSASKPKLLGQVESSGTTRFVTRDMEFNRVLGGGIVPGSIVLIGGHPGIGKSTLLLQLALEGGLKVLYVSGEESEEQIKLRADRIGQSSESCFLFTETNLDLIFQAIDELEPGLVIIDSIQTAYSPLLESTPGSISQIRECTGALQRYAKTSGIPIFIIGHINKEGDIAGPKLLEHIVDTVLQFEGDNNNIYRILRTKKNRFGSTDELGIYEMRGTGLRQVDNPSEMLISQKDEDLSGSAIAATVEGLRPMLIEAQALVSSSVYSTSQRSATGFDLRRLAMLLAVLEKRAGVHFIQQDVFLNIAGGIRVDDPAIDLAIAAALISSLEDNAIPEGWCFAGEIGLSGEIRAVNRIESRIQEASKLGFTNMVVSKYNMKGISASHGTLKLHPLGKVTELVTLLLG